jgi:hypothetical protein
MAAELAGRPRRRPRLSSPAGHGGGSACRSAPLPSKPSPAVHRRRRPSSCTRALCRRPFAGLQVCHRPYSASPLIGARVFSCAATFSRADRFQRCQPRLHKGPLPPRANEAKGVTELQRERARCFGVDVRRIKGVNDVTIFNILV